MEKLFTAVVTPMQTTNDRNGNPRRCVEMVLVDSGYEVAKALYSYTDIREVAVDLLKSVCGLDNPIDNCRILYMSTKEITPSEYKHQKTMAWTSFL